MFTIVAKAQKGHPEQACQLHFSTLLRVLDLLLSYIDAAFKLQARVF